MAFPTTIFVDAEGIVRQTYLGENPNATSPISMEQYLETTFAPRMRGQDSVILQQAENDCGIASLDMIFKHFRIQPPERSHDSLKTNAANGLSMLMLQEISQAAGLKAEGWRYTFQDFAKCQKPAIVFLRGNHFAVADSTSEVGIVYLRDPARGSIEINRSQFERIWDGRTLVFQKK